MAFFAGSKGSDRLRVRAPPSGVALAEEMTAGGADFSSFAASGVRCGTAGGAPAAAAPALRRALWLALCAPPFAEAGNSADAEVASVPDLASALRDGVGALESRSRLRRPNVLRLAADRAVGVESSDAAVCVLESALAVAVVLEAGTDPLVRVGVDVLSTGGRPRRGVPLKRRVMIPLIEDVGRDGSCGTGEEGEGGGGYSR